MLVIQIREDMKNAMKAKDTLRVQTLRGALAAFTNELVSKNMKPTEEVPDAMAVSVLKRLAKQRKDSAEQFAKGGRQDLVDKETKELNILKSYLPQEMDEAQLKGIIQEAVKEAGAQSASDMGKVMKVLMPKVAGKADNKSVSDLVKKVLSEL